MAEAALLPIDPVPAPAPGAAPAPAPGAALHAVQAPTPPPAPEPRLEIPHYDLSAALTLERELGVSHAFAQVLVRRGQADPQDAREFLEAGEGHDPSEFDGIELAVESIRRAIAVGGRIVVHGDYDVDGVCATAIMVRALRALGGNVSWFLPDRIDDGYGLSADTVTRLASRGCDLLLTVDCAVTAVPEVAAARAAGLEVVVTDHHAPRADGVLPECPIVHPALCAYPCADLCGSGVAYKLAQALGAPTAEEDLELVALATVADVMSLRGENRRLVRAGLAALANTAKPGLRALMAVSRADPSALDTYALGFRLGPRINAAGRLRRADAGLELLLTEDQRRADQIAAELDAVNLERRAVERQILWEAQAEVERTGARSAYVLAAEGWHPGVIGIVASRIAERYHRPAILVALDGEVGTGSGRSIPGFDLLDALHAAADCLDRYGGHRAAAGLSLSRARLHELREAVERHAESVLPEDLLQPLERIDAVVSGTELGLGFAEELRALEPCGMGNPNPKLLVPGARFEDPRPMGEGKHARFTVSSGGTRARAVSFGCDGHLGVQPRTPVDASFRLELNVYNGAVEPRLLLRHARPCAPAPIEVLGEPADFLDGVLAELDLGAAVAGARSATPTLQRRAATLELTNLQRQDEELEPRANREPDTATLGRSPPPTPGVTLDRRGESALAVLADALAGDGPVLAVCADVPRRLPGLSARVGGFALISYHALECAPDAAAPFDQIVALDPPASAVAKALLQANVRFTHLAWGEPELRFAEQMHELEYGLRASLVALYRSLRPRKRVTGEELERLLRGDGPHGRPARLAARLVRVLAELELVSLDRDLPALAIAGTAPTSLERSSAYRVYARRYEDGRRFLSSANPRPSG
jgi:single-stranded-DNA-specific exonuclease